MESVTKDHETRIEQIRKKLFEKYSLVEPCLELKKIMEQASKKYKELLALCEELELKYTYEPSELERLTIICQA